MQQASQLPMHTVDTVSQSKMLEIVTHDIWMIVMFSTFCRHSVL